MKLCPTSAIDLQASEPALSTFAGLVGWVADKKKHSLTRYYYFWLPLVLAFSSPVLVMMLR